MEKPEIHSHLKKKSVKSIYCVTCHKLISRNFCSKMANVNFSQLTVRKVKNFSPSQILREINFESFWSLKKCQLKNFRGIEFQFLGISQLKMSKNSINLIFRAAKMVKMTVFDLLKSAKEWFQPKSNRQKKSRNFHTVKSGRNRSKWLQMSPNGSD